MTPVNTNNQYERWVKTTSEVLSKHIHLMVEIKNIALVVRRNIVFTVFREHRIFDILMKKTTVEVKSLQLAARIAVPAWNSVGGVGVSPAIHGYNLHLIRMSYLLDFLELNISHQKSPHVITETIRVQLTGLERES